MVLTAVFRLNPIKALDSYLHSPELIDRLEGVLCARRYYEPRLVHALALCQQRLRHNNLSQAVAERDGQIASLNQAVTERDGQIAGFTQAVAERDRQIANLNEAMAERDGQIAGFTQAVAERDGQIASLSQAVAERDGQIASLNEAMAERNWQIDSVNQAMAGRDRQIANLNQAMAERDGQIAGFTHAVAEHDRQIARFTQAVAERDGQIASINQIVNERDGQIIILNQAATERNGQIGALNQVVTERDEQIATLNQVVVGRDTQISEIYRSTSWRITTPLRLTRRMSRALTDPAERYALLKSAYWHLPEFLRHRLHAQRASYVAAHWNAGKQQNKVSESRVVVPLALPEWVKMAQSSAKVVVIPCAFEFDELVNQRPINAAKYFANRGYLVLFIAWQWGRKDELTKGCSAVWPGVYQVPMFEFVDLYKLLSPKQVDAQYLVTLPAKVLVDCVIGLRNKGYAIVYDVMDDWQEFFNSGQAPWYERQVEEQLVLQSDVVSCVAPALVKKFANIRNDILLIGNGYSADVIGREYRGIAQTTGAKRPVVGYFGHLTDAWFDWKLVFDLAARHGNVRFEIIGYGEPQWVRDQARRFDNLTLVGKVHPSELSAYVRHWRAGIIPFVEGPLSRAVDPIKIYEYIYISDCLCL